MNVSTESTKTPRVSIGLPVYNGEKYIRFAIDSLLAQTFRDFELIISDNASSDGTESICRLYASQDKRIRYVREHENRGARWNFNRVVELAKGEYFKWAAADDICKPPFIARCVEVLDNDSTVVCCHTRTVKIDSTGKELFGLPDPTDGGLGRLPESEQNELPARKRPDGSSHSPSQRLRDVLVSIGWSARSYAVIRRNALLQTGLIRPYYGSEKILMAELSLIGRFHDVNETLFQQRIHIEASSNLESVAEQQQFFDPDAETRKNYPRLQLLRGYLTAVGRQSPPLGVRFLCYIWILRYLFQVSKWKKVLLSIVGGKGTGGGSRKTLKKLDNNDKQTSHA